MTSIFPLFEQGFQQVQKNICGSCPSMSIGFARGYGPLDLTTKTARIRCTVGEDVKQVWQEEMANCSTIYHLPHEEAGPHVGVLDAHVESSKELWKLPYVTQ